MTLAWHGRLMPAITNTHVKGASQDKTQLRDVPVMHGLVTRPCVLCFYAGMTHTLPADIQARLQAQAALGNLSLQQRMQQQQQPQLRAGHSSRMAALLLDVEARDPRTASDVVLQLLAFRPAAAPGAAMQLPSSLSSVYFTLQFYKSGPLVTDTCLLAASPQGQGMGADGTAGMQGPSTFMMLPQQQQPSGSSPAGAGVVLKFSIDGSRPSELQAGQDSVQAAADAHVAFCKYLVSHKLAVDVWDGESLLQVRPLQASY